MERKSNTIEVIFTSQRKMPLHLKGAVDPRQVTTSKVCLPFGLAVRTSLAINTFPITSSRLNANNKD